MNEKELRRALFWCSLLRPLIYGEVGDEEVTRRLREIAAQEVSFPDGRRKKPSLSTLRRKWKLWQQGGLEALGRKPRSDRGQVRNQRQQMIDYAVELKKDQPLRSDETINQFLLEKFGQTLPKSTLYRHLKQAGATRLKLGVAKTKVRCRSRARPDQRPLAGRLRGRAVRLRRGSAAAGPHTPVRFHRLP